MAEPMEGARICGDCKPSRYECMFCERRLEHTRSQHVKREGIHVMVHEDERKAET